jgi:hypothetical protein
MFVGKNSLAGRSADPRLNGTGESGNVLARAIFRLRRRQNKNNNRRKTTAAPAEPPTAAANTVELLLWALDEELSVCEPRFAPPVGLLLLRVVPLVPPPLIVCGAFEAMVVLPPPAS